MNDNTLKNFLWFCVGVIFGKHGISAGWHVFYWIVLLIAIIL